MANADNKLQLENAILELLRESGQEFTADELEKKLVERYCQEINPREVREAIWRLVADRQAVLTPRRAVKVP